MTLRLWIDGCFDGFHYAHANAFRQALFLVQSDSRPIIFAGIHSDKEIIKNKGPPLFDESERYALIRGCRWVYEVVEDVPYVTQFAVTRGKNIDYVLHGDDIVTDAEGNDCYGAFKAAGKYLEFKRTEGISSTALIQRLLQPELWSAEGVDSGHLTRLVNLFVDAIPYVYPVIHYTQLQGIENFEAVSKAWPGDKKVAYIGGSWDCFGSGHVELLRRAKLDEHTLLVVGIWSDQLVQEKTEERPLLTLLERALAVIQCKYSDAILLAPPGQLPVEDALSLGINILVNQTGEKIKHVIVEEPALQNIGTLREKLVAQREAYEERQKRKGASFRA